MRSLALAALVATAPALAAPNHDRAPGVVQACGSFLQRAWRDVTAAVQRLAVHRPASHANVVVIEDDGALLENDDLNLCGVAQAYYRHHPDDRHMLFVFSAGGGNVAKGFEAYYSSVRNDVKGIGRAVEDRSARCGSKGVLLGFANMNTTDHWKSFMAPLLDLWPMGVITHEIGHQWIAYITTPIKGIRLTTDPDSPRRSHWQPLFHTRASPMYGNQWVPVPGSSVFHRDHKRDFVSDSLPRGFSALDKYLMGIARPQDVKGFWAIDATKSHVIKHYAMPLNTAHGKKVEIGIGDIQQAAGGPRMPDWRSSQKKFNAAFILVVPKGRKASESALGVVEHFRKRFPAHFRGATDRKMEIATALPPSH